ncbi:uncharacterized protein F5891DRAFT_539354 [Suillus fuscotomentosus]|uniref:Uncharacterized protein n=1 Tax=Suillus fuscotomentosus TaxID=1912939 RepID=A0AAD4DZX9_9AGAM|nr:uncharacterized protein F5891DRAFT_539354 [Suillus fuscotomentosus]KAG1897203.1 hypothetical protein F5891DRAFT_539354 [Suillus fuscotomentosus]
MGCVNTDIRGILCRYMLPHVVCIAMDIPSPCILCRRCFIASILLSNQGRQLTTQDAHMTLIRVHNCHSDDDWLAGQHVGLRIFFCNKDKVFESHDFFLGATFLLVPILTQVPSRCTKRWDWTRVSS